jgi:hypothetical protein
MAALDAVPWMDWSKNMVSLSCTLSIPILTFSGPFLWQPGQFEPFANPYSYVFPERSLLHNHIDADDVYSCRDTDFALSWTNLTNMVYIDQPVSTGFSQGNITVNNEADVASQFMGFWKNFIKTFQMQGFKVYSQFAISFYFAGYTEYASDLQRTSLKYVPVRAYMSHMKNIPPLSIHLTQVTHHAI